MIHMLSSFDLNPDEDFGSFAQAYQTFLDDLHDSGMIAGAGPLGRRVAATPMDTDTGKDTP